jgi:hypothetical protein
VNWTLDGTVVRAPNGSQVDLEAMKSLEPTFDWTGFLQALALILTPLPPANIAELESATEGLQAATSALLTLTKGTK